ncbi:interferon alpha-inducible protein 27-like protein 1 [Rhizophagus clarus]|uniref:Interferon alpha-inducible protein 27-like protein 1 n=1 Tax=Rhizophagus clarus TaxID=94130 RepID=A0A8H3QPD0_9GLOM|nr:interferon alpha-inducible protein 27-like protein 1 [Rhizophagus clarus]
MILSDKKLFSIILYSAFVNHKYLTPVRDVWEEPWVIGISAALTLGLVGAIVAPIIVTAIIYALGFAAGGVLAGSFAAWFMSLYEGTIASGSLVSILQSIGAAGLGVLGTSISSGFGAAIGIIIGAISGSELTKYLSAIDLNSAEEQILGKLVQIQENNNTDLFILMPALLYNDTILECFFDTFISSSLFANSKLFRFYFKETNLSKLKSEEERVNHTAYNLLIGNFTESRVKYIFHDNYLVGYDLNLTDFKSSNPMINLLVEIWNVINGNVVINIDINKIRDQISDQIHKINNQINDQIHKINNQINNQIHKIDINKVKADINKVGEKINEQVSKAVSDINKVGEKINEQVSNAVSDVNKVGEKINEQVNKAVSDINKVEN